MLGPALTRLTANQAILLKDTPVITWFGAEAELWESSVCKFSTVDEKMQELGELHLWCDPQPWPPANRRNAFGYNSGFPFGGACYPCYGKPESRHWVIGFGEESQLLAITPTSCRVASNEEYREFERSTAASDADRFDMHLSYSEDMHRLYGFLDPSARRKTGQVKAAMCC